MLWFADGFDHPLSARAWLHEIGCRAAMLGMGSGFLCHHSVKSLIPILDVPFFDPVEFTGIAGYQGGVLCQCGAGLEQGLEWREAMLGKVVCSTPERAILELCDDALMQGMVTLRPQRLEMLLRHCHSIKAKRLFFALAERHGHAWSSHLSLDGVNLRRGKRSLVPCGRLHPRYQITLPGDLDEQLG